jgi:hypothetical protein
LDKYTLFEKLRNVEETLLIDLLGLTSEEIVNRFYDVILDRFDYIHDQLDDEQ